MPNTNTPMGFVPYRHLGGGQIRAQAFALASGYSQDIFYGDPVILSSGKVAIALANSNPVLGIFAGVSFRDSQGGQVFSRSWRANTATLGAQDATAYVYVDPMISYKVQSDTGTAFAMTHIGGSFALEADYAGNHITGQSRKEIDLGDTATQQFTVVGFIDEPGNEVGVNAKLEVVNNLPIVGN